MSTTISDTNAKSRRRTRQLEQHRVKTFSKSESIISKQVFANRRNEIHEYLMLFGYKADKTIIQVHVTGFFRKKGQQENEKEKHAEQQQ
jgi:hypothetical protein